MIKVENSVVIDKPVGDVFDVVGDPVKDPQWHFDVVEAAAPEGAEGEIRTGATYRWVFDYMGEGRQEATVEIKGYEPERRLDLVAVAGPLVQDIGYRLEPLGPSSTLMTRTLSLSHEEIPPHMEEAIKPRIHNRGAQYLARLRNVLEGGPPLPSEQGCPCCEG